MVSIIILEWTVFREVKLGVLRRLGVLEHIDLLEEGTGEAV